jgi:proteasome lid subunit RPN8/RPN11
MANDLTLPQAFIDEMIAHAREEEPHEACGVVLRQPDGVLKLYRATNAEASPFRFSIPPTELHFLYRTMDECQADLLVIYHSHTKTEACPSPTDIGFARMSESAAAWPYWVVVSLQHAEPDVRAWRIAAGEPHEISWAIGEPPAGSVRLRLETIENPQGRPRTTVREALL